METKKINKYKANVISSLKIIVRFLREPLNSMFVTVLTFVFNTNLTFTFSFFFLQSLVQVVDAIN